MITWLIKLNDLVCLGGGDGTPGFSGGGTPKRLIGPSSAEVGPA